MGRAQALTRKVLLGWLAAEWFGILVAYLVAYVAFAFLIGVIAVRVFAIEWPIPLLAFTVAGGLYLLFRAFQLPLDLLRQSRADPYSDWTPAATEVGRPANAPRTPAFCSSDRTVGRSATVVPFHDSPDWSLSRGIPLKGPVEAQRRMPSALPTAWKIREPVGRAGIRSDLLDEPATGPVDPPTGPTLDRHPRSGGPDPPK
jgi:hypothetical protein